MRARARPRRLVLPRPAATRYIASWRTFSSSRLTTKLVGRTGDIVSVTLLKAPALDAGLTPVAWPFRPSSILLQGFDVGYK